ncbi:FAD-dependent oxidoreductase [Candidatus Parcubacteria bacterium]|nr:FAD-dependent oxidoreductase [Candidatus Parcubacteria bacterium]
MHDLIIIGGGPAGIAAGIYASRKKLNCFLITKNFLSQAAKTSSIENYPGFKKIGGMALVNRFEKHLNSFEIDINQGEEVEKIIKKGNFFEIKTTQKDRYKAKAVIIATGADPRPLDVPGEKEFTGRGVAYCSTCDAPFFQDKKVAVIGGGNSGFEAALDLTPYAANIYIYEFGDKSAADEIIQEKVSCYKKIEIFLRTRVKEIKGRGKVQSIVYQDRQTKKTYERPVEGVFIQVGSIPATGFVKGLVNFSKRDEIKIDAKSGQTKTPGLFAAGDATDVKYKQVIIAAGEGAKAALSAYEYLQKFKN